jgi:putative membrane-bound dehydrogenase-like protein
MKSNLHGFKYLLSVLIIAGAMGVFLHVTSLVPSQPALAVSAASDAVLASLKVPDGFSVERVAGPGLTDYPMCITFDDQGCLYITESSGLDVSGEEMAEDRQCRIRRIEDTDGDGVFDKSTVYAEHLSLPMGALWYHGSLYVASPPDFYRYDDPNGDGVSDHRETVLTGWNVLNTASLHGPFLSPDGWLYLTHGRHGYKIQTKEGPVVEGEAARLWRCRPDGTHLERVCGGGFDNPVELIFTEAGEILGTMTYFTDPKNGQRDAIDHWIEGGVYPKVHDVLSEFIRTGDLLPTVTKFARVAPSGFVRYRNAAFGAEYQGNLFTAQFNPHRVQRHKLFREGASFRTEDSDFLTSTDPDFHPTDVAEDADGSLLVVDTGGWYVHACPLSRISKPDIHGAIYRIRRKVAPRVEDPRGKKLDLEKMKPQDLVKRLSDPRPAVEDRALEAVIEKGDAAIAPLSDLLKSKKPSAIRCQAVWGLTRIGSPKAVEAVRSALKDSEPMVLIAAAHSLGMAKDAASVEGLMKLVSHDDLAVRRQADEALGQIGEVRAAEAVLRSVTGVEDPFLEHAATYALIRLGDTQPLVSGLQTPDSTIRKCALIALDQIGGGALKKEQASILLGDTSPKLRKAALWVLSRHPDWAGEVIGFLRTRLLGPTFEAGEAAGVKEALLAFCQDPGIQGMVAELLTNQTVDPERKIFLCDALDACSLGALPPDWIAALGKLLSGPDANLRWRALSLVRSRGIADLDSTLQVIARDPKETDAFRVTALSGLIARNPELDDGAITLLMRQLDPKVDPTLRRAAAQVLGRSQLASGQVMVLAKDAIPTADGVILPALLDAFRNGQDEQAGHSLVASLLSSSEGKSVLREDFLKAVLANYSESVKAEAQPLFERMKEGEEEKIQKFNELEPLLAQGDVGRGRQVFFGQKAACSTCHTIGREGGTLGPDLTSVGAIRSGRDLLEAVLFPSSTFVPDYEPYQIETSDDFFSGVIGQQTADSILLKTGADAEVRIPKTDIVEMSPSTVSVMPAGLDSGMTREELLDLMAFLRAQNGNEWLLPEK